MDLEEEINKLKEQLKSSYNTSNSNYIYLRLSALDNTVGDKSRQIKDAISKLKADFDSLIKLYPELNEGFKLFIEVKSAYKNSTREEFIKMCREDLFPDTSVYDLIEGNVSKEEKNLYMSSYDRISRVFFTNLTFQLVRKLSNVNILTLVSEEVDFEKKNKDIINQENMLQTMFVFQLMMLSSMAAKHSEDLSVKVKKRVTKQDGVTISSKTGKKWGVAKTISKSMEDKIVSLYDRYTATEIAQRSDVYQTKQNIKQPISVNTIRAIITRRRKA